MRQIGTLVALLLLATNAFGADYIMLATQDGGQIRVKNFLNDPTTQKDRYNPGYYNLGYNPMNKNAPFAIEYMSQTQFFAIAIRKEPLARSRNLIERYLLDHLGVPPNQLCRVKYQLGVPNFVSRTYAGTDLRFSFCPGAVRL